MTLLTWRWKHKSCRKINQKYIFLSHYVCLFPKHQPDFFSCFLQGPFEECTSWKQHSIAFCQPTLELICCCSSSLLNPRLKKLCYVLTSAPHPFSWTPLTRGLDKDGYQRACPKTWPRHMVAWQGSKVTSEKYDSGTSSVFTDAQPEGERGRH